MRSTIDRSAVQRFPTNHINKLFTVICKYYHKYYFIKQNEILQKHNNHKYKFYALTKYQLQKLV